MGGIRGSAFVFNVVGSAQHVEFPFEFGPIVRPDCSRPSEAGEDLFLEGGGYGVAGFILDKGKDAKFAETANGGQEVVFGS